MKGNGGLRNGYHASYARISSAANAFLQRLKATPWGKALTHG